MRRVINNIGLALIIIFCHACDSEVDIESAASEICDCLGSPESLDSAKFNNCYDNILEKETAWIFDDEKLNKINAQIIKSLGRNCKAAAMGDTGLSENSDIKVIEEDREPALSVDECRKFTLQEGLFYVEAYGDTTNLSLKNDTYIETFPDGSYSKLKFRWTDGCNFEIEFVESNHYIKKNMSEPGEVYQYTVIDHDKEQREYLLHGYPGTLFFQFTLHY